MFIGPTDHGYSQENREAMYRWFNRATGVSHGHERAEADDREGRDPVVHAARPGGRAEVADRLLLHQGQVAGAGQARGRTLAGEALRAGGAPRCSKLPPRAGRRPTTASSARSAAASIPSRTAPTYAVETEPGIHALVYLLLRRAALLAPAAGASPRAVLYVSHQSSDAELRDEPLVAELLKAEPEAAFYACDVRGIGESRPDTCGKDQFLAALRQRLLLRHPRAHARPPLPRPEDATTCCACWTGSRPTATARSTWPAKGWGALPATFAALLSPLVVQVTLKNALTSYAEVAESETLPLAAVGAAAGRAARASTCPTATAPWPPRSSGRSSPGRSGAERATRRVGKRPHCASRPDRTPWQ